MEDKVWVNYYKIDDKDYIVLKELTHNNKDYVYLVNETDSKDILIRNVKGNNLLPLDSEEELKELLELFVK